METAEANSASTGKSIDSLDAVEKNRNHPLYLHPSDTPGSVLTSVQLTGAENYSLWSRSMLITLRAKSKLGFVLGTCKKTDYKLELEEQWEKCNAFVHAWIMNTVSKELLSGIVYASDAAVVWADLSERFNKLDGSRSYQLHREIFTLSQGNMSVSGYFTKLRLLWDEFDALVPPPSCNCDKSGVYVDHIQYLRLFAFLMGLNEVYSHARSQILMMNPLPNVSRAYAMIISDESQRITAGSKMNGEVNESVALYPGKGNYYKGKGGGCDSAESNDQLGLYAGRSGKTGNFNTHKQRRNWNLFCDHCRMNGHTKDICYKLVGYPTDWKFKKKSGPNVMQNNRMQRDYDTVHHVTAARSEMELRDAFSPADSVMKGKNVDTQPFFTPSQYSRILHMLEKEESSSSSSKELDNMANMAGMITISNALSVNNDSTQIKAEKGEGSWIVDSGATCHMTYNLDKLCHASESVNKMVHLPNGETAQVSHTGCCSTAAGDVLGDVLVVPAFKHNLLSVSKLTRQLNCSVNFFPELFVLQDLSNGKVKGIGKEANGLYYLPAALLCEENKNKRTQTVMMTQHTEANRMLWHNRLGHPSTTVLQQLFTNNISVVVMSVVGVPFVHLPSKLGYLSA